MFAYYHYIIEFESVCYLKLMNGQQRYVTIAMHIPLDATYNGKCNQIKKQ